MDVDNDEEGEASMKKGCEHDWMYCGPIWKRGNIYAKYYMCRKCYKTKEEDPYEIKGRKRIAVTIK
jgi:hypothetical protein